MAMSMVAAAATAVCPSCNWRSTINELEDGASSSSYFSGGFRTGGSSLALSLSNRRRRGGIRRCEAVGTGDTGDASQDEEKPRGFWDDEEGRRKLDEIFQMRELIEEAEKLRKAAEMGQLGGQDAIRAAQLQEELARRATEKAQRRKQAEAMFQLAQRAYGRGAYNKAVELLEAALTNVSNVSNLGGEIQLWLAMAYEAHNRHDDCIRLYRQLERSHPSFDIKRRAADLRYILDAPKLKISKEERVSIPIFDSYYRSSEKTWSQMVQERRRLSKKKRPSSEPSLDEWLVWEPPRWERSPYFWVALTVWLTLAGISLMFQD